MTGRTSLSILDALIKRPGRKVNRQIQIMPQLQTVGCVCETLKFNAVN